MHNISYFIGNQSNVSEMQLFYAKEFCELGKYFSKCVKGDKHSAYWVRGELSGRRNDENLKSSRLIVIDGDEGKNGRNAPNPIDVSNALKELGYSHFIYTSHSHKKDKNKFRCVVSCSEYEKKHLIDTNIYIMRSLREKGVFIKHVREMDAWSQPWFVPTRDDPNDGLFQYHEWFKGSELKRVEISNSREGKTSGNREDYSNSDDAFYMAMKSGNGVHPAIVSLSQQCVYEGCSKQFALRIIVQCIRHSGLENARQERYCELIDEYGSATEELKRIVYGANEKKVGNVPKKDKIRGKVPKFPLGVLHEWPEPWGIIFDGYNDVARDPVEELLVPTILSTCAHLLNNNYITLEGKLLSMIFLNLASSGVGKDANTTSVIKELSKVFMKRDAPIPLDPFGKFLQYNKSLTSDTAFMQCFDESGAFFWINTEATRIFELMGAKGNSSVAAISDKLVEVGDGGMISSKKKAKASENVESVQFPNCQVLLCAQPDTISSYLTHNMIDSGLFGRPLISISSAEVDLDEYDMFGNRDVRKLNLSDDFINLFLHLDKLDRPRGGIAGSIPLGASPDQISILNSWCKSKIVPSMKEDKTMHTVLRRMGIPIEQLYCLVLGITQEYEKMKYREIKTQTIDIEILIPLLDYWVECKIYATEHLVRGTSDPLCDAVVEIMGEVIEGKIKMSKMSHVKAVERMKVPLAKLSTIVSNRSRLIRELELTGDNKALQSKLRMAINALCELNVIMKCKSDKVECIAFPE